MHHCLAFEKEEKKKKHIEKIIKLIYLNIIINLCGINKSSI